METLEAIWIIVKNVALVIAGMGIMFGLMNL